ncbi:MAG: hypothetical protein WD100_12080, partial [Tistlia sp.]
ILVPNALAPDALAPGAPAPGDDPQASTAPGRASIAVMPFLDQETVAGARGGSGDGIAQDITTRLSKLRSLFVIAQGTLLALDERRFGPAAVGRALDVDYIVTGALRRQAGRLVATVELAETRTARVVWSEVYDRRQDDAFRMLDEIGDSLVASIAQQVEAAERNRAILKHPRSLNAWEAYHRGVWHMYRYSRPDNEQAQHFLEQAVALDPTFARAYAALSFTHFQNAFQRWREREAEIGRAFETAGQGLLVDEQDPAAHWAMGRALWLRGSRDQALRELETAVALSPSFAHGHYTLSFVHAQVGDPQAAVDFSDHSRLLSPFDPLLCAMLTTRALALVRLGRLEEAADWSAKAAARPNAFSHLRAITACLLALTDRGEEARTVAADVQALAPGYRVEDLLATFRFPPEVAEVFRTGARRVGMG